MGFHKGIGKLPFKPKKGFVLPKHRFTGPFNLLHLQLDSKDNPLPGNEPLHKRFGNCSSMVILGVCGRISALNSATNS